MPDIAQSIPPVPAEASKEMGIYTERVVADVRRDLHTLKHEDSTFFGAMEIDGSADISGNLNVGGSIFFTGDFTANKIIGGDISIDGDLYVDGTADFSSIGVDGTATLADVSIWGWLGVDGSADFSKISCDGSADFSKATFDGSAGFTSAVFGSEVSIGGAFACGSEVSFMIHPTRVDSDANAVTSAHTYQVSTDGIVTLYSAVSAAVGIARIFVSDVTTDITNFSSLAQQYTSTVVGQGVSLMAPVPKDYYFELDLSKVNAPAGDNSAAITFFPYGDGSCEDKD